MATTSSSTTSAHQAPSDAAKPPTAAQRSTGTARATNSIWLLAPINPLEPPFYLAQVPSCLVVAAPDSESARKIASATALTQHDVEAWLDEALSSCDVLAPEEPGIIARDFSPAPAAAVPPAPAATTPPVNVDVPHLQGVGTVGQTLTCTMGNWQGEPTSYAYAWKSDGAAISAATGDAYLIVAADAGYAITCVVTATNALGSVAAPPSNAVMVAGA